MSFLYDLRPICQAVYSATIRDSCDTYAMLDSYDVARTTSGLAYQPISRPWLYYRSRQQARPDPQGTAATIGLLPTWDGLGLPSAHDAEAAAHKVTFNWAIPSWTVGTRPYHARILEALAANIAPSWAGIVCHNWANPGTGIIAVPTLPEWYANWGPHRICIVGWDPDNDCYLVRNMWGAGWGEGGYGRVSSMIFGMPFDGYNPGTVMFPGIITDNGVPTTVTYTPLTAPEPDMTPEQVNVLIEAALAPIRLQIAALSPITTPIGTSPVGTEVFAGGTITHASGTWSLGPAIDAAGMAPLSHNGVPITRVWVISLKVRTDGVYWTQGNGYFKVAPTW